MATIRDVAKQAGVSIASVSRALRGDPKVRLDTRQKILRAAEEIGYTPVVIPRIAPPAQSFSVGIIMYDIDNPWFMMVARCMEKLLRKEHGNLIILFDDDMRTYEEECMRRLTAAGVSGIMFYPISTKHAATVQALRARGVSILQLHSKPYADITSVTIDDDFGMLTALRHMLLAGYQRILVLGPSKSTIYAQAYGEYGLAADPSMCVSTFQEETPYETVRAAIVQKRPDAILSWADKTSRATIRVLRELNLSFPKDIGLMVYDDLPWVSMLNITAIAQPIDVIADTAVQHMLQIIRNGDERGLAASTIKPYLIERGSLKTGFTTRPDIRKE